MLRINYEPNFNNHPTDGATNCISKHNFQCFCFRFLVAYIGSLPMVLLWACLLQYAWMKINVCFSCVIVGRLVRSSAFRDGSKSLVNVWWIPIIAFCFIVHEKLCFPMSLTRNLQNTDLWLCASCTRHFLQSGFLQHDCKITCNGRTTTEKWPRCMQIASRIAHGWNALVRLLQ